MSGYISSELKVLKVRLKVLKGGIPTRWPAPFTVSASDV